VHHDRPVRADINFCGSIRFAYLSCLVTPKMVITDWNELVSNYLLVVDTMTSFGIDGNGGVQTSQMAASGTLNDRLRPQQTIGDPCASSRQ
jgi:hypothetical protein